MGQFSQAAYYDLMHAGPGTPWEDRGKRGMISAFFATCFMSLADPTRLFNSIRRPETASDARPFAIGCGLFWGAGWAVNAYIAAIALQKDPKGNFDPMTYWGATAVQFVLAPIALFFMLRLTANIYTKLARAETAVPFQPALVVNLLGYALGPSILAIIPVVGMPLAITWIFILIVVVGRSRMRIKTFSAIVDALIAMLASVALFAVIYLLVWLAWSRWTASDEPPPSLPPLRSGQ